LQRGKIKVKMILIKKTLFFVGYFTPFRIDFGSKIKYNCNKFSYNMR
jgi:hypothetical protein